MLSVAGVTGHSAGCRASLMSTLYGYDAAVPHSMAERAYALVP